MDACVKLYDEDASKAGLKSNPSLAVAINLSGKLKMLTSFLPLPVSFEGRCRKEGLFNVRGAVGKRNCKVQFDRVIWHYCVRLYVDRGAFFSISHRKRLLLTQSLWRKK